MFFLLDHPSYFFFLITLMQWMDELFFSASSVLPYAKYLCRGANPCSQMSSSICLTKFYTQLNFLFKLELRLVSEVYWQGVFPRCFLHALLDHKNAE